MEESEQVYGGSHYPPQDPRDFVPHSRVVGNMAWLCTGIEDAIGGVVVYTVASDGTYWEVRVYRGDGGVSTYISHDRLDAMTPERAMRIGRFRGQVINGIFVEAGEP